MWTASKRVLRYLKGTKDYIIRFKSEVRTNYKRQTTVFMDSSHADEKDSRRSRCGHIVYFRGSSIMWRTILQKRVSLFTAEAEYRAATYACKDVL